MKGKLIFEEKQTFRGKWTWYLVMLMAFLMAWWMVRSLYILLESDYTWGGQLIREAQAVIFAVIFVAVSIVVFFLIHFHELTLQVDQGTIRYRYLPYFRNFRTINKRDVKKVHIRKYQPIWEFGGWGYRIRPGRKAFSIDGSWGLQIEFANGKRLLIGTRRPKELDVAIESLKVNWSQNN